MKTAKKKKKTSIDVVDKSIVVEVHFECMPRVSFVRVGDKRRMNELRTVCWREQKGVHAHLPFVKPSFPSESSQSSIHAILRDEWMQIEWMDVEYKSGLILPDLQGFPSTTLYLHQQFEEEKSDLQSALGTIHTERELLYIVEMMMMMNRV